MLEYNDLTVLLIGVTGRLECTITAHRTEQFPDISTQQDTALVEHEWHFTEDKNVTVWKSVYMYLVVKSGTSPLCAQSFKIIIWLCIYSGIPH